MKKKKNRGINWDKADNGIRVLVEQMLISSDNLFICKQRFYTEQTSKSKWVNAWDVGRCNLDRCPSKLDSCHLKSQGSNSRHINHFGSINKFAVLWLAIDRFCATMISEAMLICSLHGAYGPRNLEFITRSRFQPRLRIVACRRVHLCCG